MAEQLQVAFLWHFHQPCYVHPQHGIATLPWVRLHALRGYSDMVTLAEEYPAAHQTLNWVPVLIEQLEEVVRGKADLWGELSRREPSDWTPAERAFLVEHLFSAQHRHMIEPLPRYHELLRRRRAHGAIREGSDPFRDDDLLDLVVLFHLAWTGFTVRRRPEVQALLRQGKGFDAGDRDRLFAVCAEETAGVLPRLRRLAARGGVELSSTPYHHPILPLLCELDSRRFPHAGGDQNPFEFRWPGDAEDHVRRAVAAHARVFGGTPAGMWPAEGAVSEAAAAVFAGEGLQWIASDQDILFQSLGGVADGRVLYQPYHYSTVRGDLRLVFRDHELSDRLGFVYQSWSAADAAADLIGRLDAIRKRCDHADPVVALILDGENPWEQYPGAGEEFLRRLYEGLQEHPRLRMVTVQEATRSHADPPSLARLATGSWIHGNLDTWAGQDGKLRGWRHLAAIRQAIDEQDGAPLDELPETIATSLRVIEGSDWYWWFGDDHLTEQRELFDELFRGHVRHLYEQIGRVPPEALSASFHPTTPVSPEREPARAVVIHGSVEDIYEWQHAGHFELRLSGAAMTRARLPADRLQFGLEGRDGRLLLHLGLMVPPDEKWQAVLWITAPQAIRHAATSPLAGWLYFSVPLDELLGLSRELLFQLELRLEGGDAWRWPAARLARIVVPDDPPAAWLV